MKGVFNIIYQIADIFHKMVWSNILWFLTAGFPLLLIILDDWIIFKLIFIFIFPPGTIALFHVMNLWLKKKEISIWPEYWRGWKLYWKRSYIIIHTHIFIGIILAVDFSLVFFSEIIIIKFLGGFLLTVIILLYFIISVIFFPLAVKFQWRLGKLYKYAFILSVGHLFSTLTTLLLISGLIIIGITKFPILLFLLCTSLTAWIFTWQTNRLSYIYKVNN